jgi:hypothetical protein
MKSVKLMLWLVGGLTLCGAGLARKAIVSQRQKLADSRFTDEAIAVMEAEGGIVID